MLRWIPIGFVVALVISACAATLLVEEVETPKEARFVALALFDEYDERALVVAEQPTTPVEVKVALVQARAVAKTALVLMDEAYFVYVAAEEKYLADPSEDNMVNVLYYLESFNTRMTYVMTKLNKLFDVVEGL